MAKLDEFSYPWEDYDNKYPGDFMRSVHEEDAALRKLLEYSDNLPDGEILGGVLRFPRGDGAALYYVSKARPLTLQWVPFMDRWQVEDALIKGLDTADVIEHLNRHKILNDIFAPKKTQYKEAENEQ